MHLCTCLLFSRSRFSFLSRHASLSLFLPHSLITPHVSFVRKHTHSHMHKHWKCPHLCLFNFRDHTCQTFSFSCNYEEGCFIHLWCPRVCFFFQCDSLKSQFCLCNEQSCRMCSEISNEQFSLLWQSRAIHVYTQLVVSIAREEYDGLLVAFQAKHLVVWGVVFTWNGA